MSGYYHDNNFHQTSPNGAVQIREAGEMDMSDLYDVISNDSNIAESSEKKPGSVGASKRGSRQVNLLDFLNNTKTEESKAEEKLQKIKSEEYMYELFNNIHKQNLAKVQQLIHKSGLAEDNFGAQHFLYAVHAVGKIIAAG